MFAAFETNSDIHIPLWRDGVAAFQINKYTFETHLYSCGGTALAAFETYTYSCGRTALAAFETKIYSCGGTALAAFKVVTLTLVTGLHWRYLG